MSDPFDAYLIPTKIDQGDRQVIVSAVLVLRPFPGGGNDLFLAKWPTQVANMLAPADSATASSLVATMQDIDKSSQQPTGSVVKGSVRCGLSKAYGAVSAGGRPAALNGLDQLFCRLLQPSSGLQAALAKPPASQPSVLHDAVLQAGANTGAVPKGTPDVISPGRADLSHLLKFKRAGLISQRVAAIRAGTKLVIGTPKTVARPWVDGVVLPPKPTRPAGVVGHAPDGTPIEAARLVTAAEAPASKPFTKEQSRKNQIEALQTERKNLLVKLNTFLDEKQTAPTGPARPRPYARSVTDAVRLRTMGQARTKQYEPHPIPESGAPALPQGVRRAATVAGVPGAFEQARVDLLHPHVHSAVSDAKVFDQLYPDPTRGMPPPPAGAMNVEKDQASNRWAAVLGLPALQRVLHLVVDVEIAFDAAHFQSAVPAEGRFLALGLASSGAGGTVPKGSTFFSTLTKLGKSPATIWPCTREECAGGANLVAMDQRDGVLDLEAALTFGVDSSHRFSIDTLDIHAASEGEIQRDRAQAHVAEMIADVLPLKPGAQKDDAAQQAKDAQHLLGLEKTVAAERKLRTIGCQVIDQWRDSVAIKQFVRTYDHLTAGGGTLLDADDLTLGLRLDVATDNGDTPRRWACLTNRHVAYAEPAAHGVDLERLVEVFHAAGSASPQPREAIDGVVLGAPTRLLADEVKADADAANTDLNTAYAEPIVATWDGDPLGMRSGRTVAAVPTGGVPLDLHFDLPTKAHSSEPLPPRLRFGVAYAFGLRTVLLGNVALPLAAATMQYETGAAYPQQNELKRFLRHEWIDPVMVATPLASIVDEFRDRGGLDGEMMIVRSRPRAGASDEPEDSRRFQPRVTERAVFAPRVDLNFAHLHGVFDGPDRADRLLGGLRNVDFDPAQGGFPAYAPELPPGSPLNRGTEAKAARCPGDDAQTAVPPSGLAVFQPRRRAAPGRHSPQTPTAHRYFPDPAARSFVVAIRAPGVDGLYLAGDPWIVPIYPSQPKAVGIAAPGYPHACPLTIRLEAFAVDGGATPPRCHADIDARAGGHPLRRVAIDPSLPPGPENMAQELTIRLAPGEDFTLEVWTTPDIAHVGAWFDAPESMAFLDDKDGRAVGTKAAKVIRREDMRISTRRLSSAASNLHAALQCRPVAEFAPARAFRLVHAAERPGVVPAIVSADKGVESLAFRRLDEANRMEKLNNSTDGLGGRNANDDDATAVLVDARVAIDPSTFDTIALHVEAAAPAGGQIDDPQRGRSPEDRIRGDWPAAPTKENPLPNGRAPSELLYGFKVAGDGAVNWVRHEAIYDTWRLGPTDDPVVSLLALTARGAKVKREAAGQQLFADGGARRITAWVTATARTARLIPTRKVYPDTGQQATDVARTTTLSARQTDIILRSIVRPAALPVRSLSPAFVWCDNGDRPNIVSRTRTTRIRIPFLRPAMTSGVEERVGIVLWPPNALRAGRDDWSEGDLASGNVVRAEPLGTADEGIRRLDLMTLDTEGAPPPQFRDEDLGPGGAYVTRWGADPIHEEGTLTWFITPSAFRDAHWRATVIDSITAESEDTGLLWPEKDAAPRLVENVLMPIPSGGEDAETPEGEPITAKTSEQPAAKDPQFMMVSLLTYVPRFDADSESWYVDVEIDPGVAPDPFLRLGLVRFQPHANRNLQVSMPVAEWVQVVGHSRGAEIEVKARDCLRRPTAVTLRVTGPALAKNNRTSPLVIFRASLIRRDRNALGHIVESRMLPALSSEEAPNSDRVRWEVTLPALSDWDQPGFEGYAVFVEESLRMRRSAYPDEPHLDTPTSAIDRSNDALWRDSGPRFAARLEIKSTT